MSRVISATRSRAVRVAAVAVALLVAGVLAHGATASPSPSARGNIAVSLLESSTALPLDGTLGYTGVAHLASAASSVQARLQVHRGNKLIYQRTQYASSAEEGTHTFSFSRPLVGLDLPAGEYPVTFSLHATVNGSDISTEVTSVLRIYDVRARPIGVVVLAKVHARPLADPSGRLVVDPISPTATATREQVEHICAIAQADSASRISLALPPATVEEWRRIANNGYTLASGTVVPAADPTAIAYQTALSHLQQALATGRLELLAEGYADPNLADLDANKLAGDASAQYDAGFSALFASMQATPSAGTAPAGGCVPRSMQRELVDRRVGYAFVDAESTRAGKKPAASGAYPCADSSLTALVVDARASRDLETGDASSTIAHTFQRLGTATAGQPIVLRIDLDDTISDATATVGFALSTLKALPWARLHLGGEVRPAKGAKRVTFVPQPTKNAPANYWSTVRSSRAYAAGMLAVLTSSDASATSAQRDSLLAEASAWSDPSANWNQAAAGLEFAKTALSTAKRTFGAIKLTAVSLTLAGSTGNLPVTIQNNSDKTFTVTVLVKTSTGMHVDGGRQISTRLPPRETFVPIPIDMESVLQGKVTVQVMADGVVMAKQTITVRRSYLDRLALIAGIVLVLGGMLVWIVLRVRTSPDIDDEDEMDGANDECEAARYTESHPERPSDSDHM